MATKDVGSSTVGCMVVSSIPTCPVCNATMQGTECANCSYTVSADPVSWITEAGELGSIPNTYPMCGHGMNNEYPNCGFTTSKDIIGAMLPWVRSHLSDDARKTVDVSNRKRGLKRDRPLFLNSHFCYQEVNHVHYN